MVSQITHSSPPPAADHSATTRSAPQPKTQSTPKDTVTLSPSAQIQQELAETSAQTKKEATQGDIQAKHLLARETAAKTAGR